MSESPARQQAAPAWLDADALLAEVSQRTAAPADFAVPPVPALRALADAFNAIGSRLHFFGKQRIRRSLVEALCWRVRLAQALARHPGIAAQPLPRPIFIVGPFRSGTTFLHRLLAADPRLRWLRPWEATYAPRDVPERAAADSYLQQDPRIADLQRDLGNLYRRSPQLAQLHPVAANQAEECFGFLESALLSPSFLFHAPLFDYLDWLAAVDESAWDYVYAGYRDHLRLLNWLHPGERWLLKSPVHLWNLGALRRAFPDALFIHTHRDPLASVDSLCRLIAAHHALALHTVDAPETGRLAQRFYEIALPRALAARRAAPPGTELDLHIAGASPARTLAALEAVYAAAGLTPDPALEQRVQTEAATPEHAGAAPPAREPASFGLQADSLRALFAGYDSFTTAAVSTTAIH